MLVSCSVENSY